MIPKSAVAEIRWPAIPDQPGALLMALQRQLRESQWLAADELEPLQMDALLRLLRYAVDNVPFYGDDDVYRDTATRDALMPHAWRALPVLTRDDVQEAGDALCSAVVPHQHQPVDELTTSGTTGPPVHSLGTPVTNLFWRAITLRDHLWHKRDLTGRLAAIRADLHDEIPPEGEQTDGWGPSTSILYPNGPCAAFSLRHDVARQAKWLATVDPDYLVTYPSNLMALARHFAETGAKLPRLREASTYGEALPDGLRPLVRDVWQVEVSDVYSAQEVGHLALQCPRGEQYHVQSESVYVEVLDDHDQPCRPGETGRVVVSTLHNYAMPLLRYDLGDHAEVGPPCACGRGLPVLRRIMGRERNMWALPSGQRVWPQLGVSEWAHLDAVRRLQLVQHDTDRIEVTTEGPRPLTAEEQNDLAALLRKRFDYSFDLTFTHAQHVEGAGGRKFEEFVSLVPRRPTRRQR